MYSFLQRSHPRITLSSAFLVSIPHSHGELVPDSVPMKEGHGEKGARLF